MTAIKHATNEVKCRWEPLDEILWQGRQWAVTTFGIERRDGTYTIQANRLAEHLEPDEWLHAWIAHMSEKEWVDLEDFATAFYVACAMHGVRLTKAARAKLAREFEQAVEDREHVERIMAPFREQAQREICGSKDPTIVFDDQLDKIESRARQLAIAAGAL